MKRGRLLPLKPRVALNQWSTRFLVRVEWRHGAVWEDPRGWEVSGPFLSSTDEGLPSISLFSSGVIPRRCLGNNLILYIFPRQSSSVRFSIFRSVLSFLRTPAKISTCVQRTLLYYMTLQFLKRWNDEPVSSSPHYLSLSLIVPVCLSVRLYIYVSEFLSMRASVSVRL